MFQLDMKSGKSVYEQVIDKIKELVMTGVLTEGSKLPSVRELSRQLTINPNTVQKAFKELERDGYIYTVSGKGTFIKGRDAVAVDEARVSETLSRIKEDFKALTFLGIDPREAKEMAEKAIDDELENIIGKGGSHDKR